MTIEEFRRHKYLAGQWAKELQTNGILRTVLGVMEDNHPARYAIRGDKDEDVSPTRAAIELGLTRGYSKYGDTLRILAKPVRAAENIGETSYEPPPQEKK
ncbi:MAG TPA: hypothetical protein VNS88_05025 [Nitrospiraceae bacterium]|nr:hypothetical protein [Nitrospiraceae bacterium]